MTKEKRKFLSSIIEENYTIVETWDYIDGKPSPYNILNNDSPAERQQRLKIAYGLSLSEEFMGNEMVQRFIKEEKDRKHYHTKLIGLHWGLLYWNPDYMIYDESAMLRSIKLSTKKLAFQERRRFSLSSIFSKKKKTEVDKDGLYCNYLKEELEEKYYNFLDYLSDKNELKKSIDKWIEAGLNPEKKYEELRDHAVRLYFSLVKYHDFIPKTVSVDPVSVF